MPCILKVRILAGRNLPIMDRASESTDAYVELKFGDYEVQRTPICRKSLNPIWNQDFRFECADDADAQNEPLEIRVMDYDAISYNDIIGLVFVDLNPLLAVESRELASSELAGWFPIVDTIRGIRGELSVHVKVQFFDDINPFKDSSTGVQFYSLGVVPPMQQVQALIGFADVLISEDDPEYHWTDNFRTPRTSNESRMRCMYRLAGQLRRQFGRKVMEMGANAVIGFRQFFDLESEERIITARAIGTAVKLSPVTINSAAPFSPDIPERTPASQSLGSLKDSLKESAVMSNTPLGGSVHPNSTLGLEQGSIVNSGVAVGAFLTNQVQLLTVTSLPHSVVRHLGGLVMAVSVKVIETDEENEREMWWSDLRDEIKGHVRVLGCSCVLGYSERLTIIDDVCILMCQGTACVLDLKLLYTPRIAANSYKAGIDSPKMPLAHSPCEIAHIPFKRANAPFPMCFVHCQCCKHKYVPEFMFSTTELPSHVATVGHGVLVEAHVCRTYKPKDSETVATVLSEAIPFIQYDLLRQLLYKLRLYSLNAVFGLKFQIKLGESFLVALATGTAVFLRALPVPAPIKIQSNADIATGENALYKDLQDRLMMLSETLFGARKLELSKGTESSAELDHSSADSDSDSESCSSSSSEADANLVGSTGAKTKLVLLSKGNDTHPSSFVLLQIDDTADEDLVGVLLDSAVGCGLELMSIELSADSYDSNVETQMITVYKRGTLVHGNHPNQQLSSLFQQLYRDLNLQLSYFSKCVLSDVDYDVLLLEDDEVHIRLTATAVGSITEPAALKASSTNDFSRLYMSLPEFWTMLSTNDAMQSPVSLLQALKMPTMTRESRFKLFSNSTKDSSSASSSFDWLKSLFGHLKSAPSLKFIKAKSKAASKATLSPKYPHQLVSAIASDWSELPAEDDSFGVSFAPSKSEELAFASADLTTKISNEVDDSEAVSLLKIPRRLLSELPLSNTGGGNRRTSLLLRPNDPSSFLPGENQVFQSSPTAYYNNSAPAVEITTLSFVPGATIDHYIGRISLHIVREGSLYATEQFGTFASESEAKVVFDAEHGSLSVSSPPQYDYTQLLAETLNIQDKVFSLAGSALDKHDYRPVETTGEPVSGKARPFTGGKMSGMDSLHRNATSPASLGTSHKVYLDVEELRDKERPEVDGVNIISAGGLGQFCQTVFSELNAMIRAQVAAIGGNALIGFAVEQCFIEEAFKNGGYAFCSVSGDVVKISRKADGEKTTKMSPVSAVKTVQSDTFPVVNPDSVLNESVATVLGSYNVDISSKGVHLTRDRVRALESVFSASPLGTQVQKMEYLPPPVTPKTHSPSTMGASMISNHSNSYVK